MPDPAPLPARASLRRLRNEAKQLLKRLQADHSDSVQWFRRVLPEDDPHTAKLADTQRMLARVYGFPSWTKLKQHLEAKPVEERVIDAATSGDAEELASLLDADPALIDTVGGWERMRPLFFAMQANQPDTEALLRERGATLNIFEAARLGNVAELTRLLDADPALANARREHYDATPLHCVRDAGVEAARLLLERGAHANAIDSDEQRLIPLHGRAEHGQTDMVQLLLDHAPDLHADSCMGSPLHAAVGGFQSRPAEEWQDVAQLLLDHGASVNTDMSQTGKPGWTVLHHAAWRGHDAAVVWLIARGADLAAVNMHGHTPAQTAEAHGHHAAAKLLDDAATKRARRKAKPVTLQGHLGLDVYRLARAGKTSDALTMLRASLAEDGDTTRLTRMAGPGGSAMTLWAETSDRRLLEAVRPHGIAWDAHTAACWGELPALIEASARDPQALTRTVRHGNALHWALRLGQLHIANWIARQGIDLPATEGGGYVRAATFGGHEPAIRWAAAHGAAVDHQPQGHGQTALIHEAKHCRIKRIPLLLELGADPRLKDAKGNSALSIARASGRSAKLIALLEAAV